MRRRLALSVSALVVLLSLSMWISGHGLAFTSREAASPTLGVQIDHDWINGWGFPADTTVTVGVNGAEKGQAEVRTDESGEFQLADWSGGEEASRTRAGDTVMARYDDETATMNVRDVEATVDCASNVVSGTALAGDGSPLAGKWVTSWVRDEWEDEDELASRETTVQPDGSFTLDYAGPDGADLVPGQKIVVTLCEGPEFEGHQTMRAPQNEVPSLGANIDHNWLEGFGLPPETSMTVSVSDRDGSKGDVEVKTDGQGSFWQDWEWAPRFRLRVGDRIVVSDAGETLAEMYVQDLEVLAETVADRVVGTAFTPAGLPLAGREVSVWVRQEWEDPDELTSESGSVQPDGSFVINLGGFDLEAGQKVFVTLHDGADGGESGHRTIRAPALLFPTTLAVNGRKPSTAYNSLAWFEATLTASGGDPLDGAEVYIMKSTNGSTWTYEGNLNWIDFLGGYRWATTIGTKTYFRFIYPGDDVHAPAASPVITFTSRAFVSRPNIAPSSPRRYANFTTIGFLKPRHSGYTRLYFYRRVAGRWVRYAIRNARNINHATATKYSLTTRLPYAGSWYVKAYHADAGHLATWSTPRYFTVR